MWKLVNEINHWLNVFELWEGFYLLSEAEEGIADMGFKQGKSTIDLAKAATVPSDDSFMLHANRRGLY